MQTSFLTLYGVTVVGGTVAEWLVHWMPDQMVQVPCCVLGQDTLLSQCLPTQGNKWVTAN